MGAATTRRPPERPALGDLYVQLYPELLRLARSRVRRGGEPAAIDPTALVHESFLRSTRVCAEDFADRGSFMAYASAVMRSVLVDAVRRRGSERRGGGAVHVELAHGLARLGEGQGVPARLPALSPASSPM